MRGDEGISLTMEREKTIRRRRWEKMRLNPESEQLDHVLFSIPNLWETGVHIKE
jgi:hypothetical protein